MFSRFQAIKIGIKIYTGVTNRIQKRNAFWDDFLRFLAPFIGAFWEAKSLIKAVGNQMTKMDVFWEAFWGSIPWPGGMRGVAGS